MLSTEDFHFYNVRSSQQYICVTFCLFIVINIRDFAFVHIPEHRSHSVGFHSL